MGRLASFSVRPSSDRSGCGERSFAATHKASVRRCSGHFPLRIQGWPEGISQVYCFLLAAHEGVGARLLLVLFELKDDDQSAPRRDPRR
jgi:hypothetical protein